MSKPKKVNPRRIPCTQANVDRARDQGVTEAVRASMAIFMTVLLDKEGADKEILQRAWGEIESLSQSVKEKRVSIPDPKRVLNDEYDIQIS